MKSTSITLLLFLLYLTSYAQKNVDPQNMKVITNAEPAYPKGDAALYSEVMFNTKYPEAAIKKFVEGEVTLSFDVKPDSSVSNIMIISGVGSGVDEEVKNTISKLKFSPGIQNGRVIKMNTMYTIPVKAH